MSWMIINLLLAGGILSDLEEIIGGNLLEFIDEFGGIYWKIWKNLLELPNIFRILEKRDWDEDNQNLPGSY